MITDKELLKIAKDMQSKAYAPYSGYQVGAALLCADGKVITGCNVENISYGGTICAERTALVKAIAEGEKEFKKIAISVTGEELGIPCGICLQFMSEFVEDDFEVICGNNLDALKSYKFSELFPIAFHSKSIKKEVNNENKSVY